MSKLNLPTKITVTRIFAIPLIVVLYVLQCEVHNLICIATALLYIITSATDFVDGHIARKYNLVTDLGKFLDPIADKVVVLTGVFIVADGGMISVPYVAMICGVIIVARELIIGLLRQIAAIKNVVLAADGLGKAKTATTMTAIGTLLFVPCGGTFGAVIMWLGMVELIVATILTVWSGVHYVVANKAVLAEDKFNDKNSTDSEQTGGDVPQGDREEK